jgi:hypothetical protein
MNTTEIFLIAMTIIFTVPYLIWRLGRTDYYAPLVVVQIITGILLGPGILGRVFPDYYSFVFNPAVVQSPERHCLVGGDVVRLHRRHRARPEKSLGAPPGKQYHGRAGARYAAALRLPRRGRHACGRRLDGAKSADLAIRAGRRHGLRGDGAAHPDLLMEKLDVLRQPIGQRILRYASLDDIAIWGVLALILMDWERIGKQVAFLLAFACWLRLAPTDALAGQRARPLVRRADLAGAVQFRRRLGRPALHGRRLPGRGDHGRRLVRPGQMDLLRHHVLLVVMPVFFLSTGLRTNWTMGGGWRCSSPPACCWWPRWPAS